MAIYLRSLKDMYSNALADNHEIYDIAAKLTGDFLRIEPSAVLSDSRIIKILRYAVAPSISQMKFGQFFGLKTVKRFEEARAEPKSRRYRDLQGISSDLTSFVSESLDRRRFRWTVGDTKDRETSMEYAKEWTCSLAADQNAQTRYRNWRKDQQEYAIAAYLIGAGYVKSAFTGVVRRASDLSIGEFTTERKIAGRTIQKADLVVRSKRPGHRLVLVEAKAVGVELDSTKRIKECCDKASDWGAGDELGAPTVVAVIAGFFNEGGVANLGASGVTVVWEHRLEDLGKVL